MAGDLLLGIDQGTTGTTALLLDHESRVVALRTSEVPIRFPAPGLVEQDADAMWASVASAVSGVLAGVDPSRIAAIGITNQRETCLLWDAASGVAAHPAIVWQDRRTLARCEELREAGHEPRLTRTTGLLLDPYFTATKAEWLLDHVEGAREGAREGRLRLGTVDAWLVERLTGEFVTDPSNASRTLLFDLERLDWDDGLLDLFGVPRASLPRLVNSSGVVGKTRGPDRPRGGIGFLPDGIPVAGIAGDQQAALFGQACFQPGMAKCTYGTGAFVLLNTGTAPRFSSNRLLTTVAWKIGDETTYALEGSAFVAGAAVQWLRDGLGFIASAAEVEALAVSVPDSGGVVFVPALAGLGAPWWRPAARGVRCGLTRGSTRARIARAVLAGVRLQVA
ncbi:MAG: glycerol kinase, partial [Acidobacteria bacterium]|nr:glycerol kinase [Acidobacteriota bacterium]